MELEGEGKLLHLFIGESDTWHGKPLYQAFVERVREEGLAGATVVRGIEGFGADPRIHTSRILRLSEDLPVVIEIVGTPEQIDRVVPILDEMVGEGMLTLEKVQIVSYRSSDAWRPAATMGSWTPCADTSSSPRRRWSTRTSAARSCS